MKLWKPNYVFLKKLTKFICDSESLLVYMSSGRISVSLYYFQSTELGKLSFDCILFIEALTYLLYFRQSQPFLMDRPITQLNNTPVTDKELQSVLCSLVFGLYDLINKVLTQHLPGLSD